MVYRTVTTKVIETKEESDIPNCVGEKGQSAKAKRSMAGKQNYLSDATSSKAYARKTCRFNYSIERKK
jgi:hypothetical protein